MKKLLAIVDDWEKLERYAERFAPWYEVIEAPFGALGVDLAREHAPEIDQILVDLTFEDMTEWEARACLRGDPKTAKLPVTFVMDAGTALPEGWDPAVDRGVPRPYVFEELLASLMTDTVLRFWFGTEGKPDIEFWFGGTPEIDERIRAAFAPWVEAAARGQLDRWRSDRRRLLALIILLDQFSLNIYRDRPESFEQSARAVPLSLTAIERGWDLESSLVERLFFYLPLEHAEDLALQERAVACFKALVAAASPSERELAEVLLDYAVRHWEVIQRFGRFPDRNPILGREPTPEEAAYVAAGGPPF